MVMTPSSIVVTQLHRAAADVRQDRRRPWRSDVTQTGGDRRVRIDAGLRGARQLTKMFAPVTSRRKSITSEKPIAWKFSSGSFLSS
jgi:hypothetical protein